MPFVTFESVDRAALRWLKTGGAVREYTLLAGDSAVASVRWSAGRSATATVATADGNFVLERAGLLVPHLTIRRSESEPPLARLVNRLGHHEVELGQGESFRVRRAGLLVPAWTVSGPDGKERLHIEPVADGRQLGGGAVLVRDAKAPRELLLLVLLAWYLIVLLWIEDEALEALTWFEGMGGPPAQAP